MSAIVDRRALLGGLAATAVAAGTPALAATAAAGVDGAPSPDRVSFLAIGDWGVDGEQDQTAVARRMANAAKTLSPRFTLAVGDNFYNDGVMSANDSRWRTSFEDIYFQRSLQVPWYAVLGNHDYNGNPEAQVDYGRKGKRWRMPARYYKVAGAEVGFEGADFFFLDTSPLIAAYALRPGSQQTINVLAQDGPAQLAWLDEQLGASTAPWKIVVGHHTIRSGGSAHGSTPDMIARVLPLLQKHGVRVYIGGHDHDMQHIAADGLHYIQTGCGSEARPVAAMAGTRFCLAQSGFSAFTLTPEALDVSFTDYRGKVVYRTTIPASEDSGATPAPAAIAP
jgi:tartrate-resistant acid phosphatase type 5